MVSTSAFVAASRRRGFTLIELMVATAIMTLLVLAVMTVTSHVLGTWSSASGRLGANAEARTALQYLGDDLETLVVRPKQQVWLEVEYENVSLGQGKTVRVPNISLISATEHRVRPSTNDYGNICAINYQIAFQNPIIPSGVGTPEPLPTAGLYRKVIGPQDTFNDVLNFQSGNSGALVSLKDTVDGLQGSTATFANFLSSNIVDLSVDFYAEDLDESLGSDDRVKKIDGDFMYADKVYEITSSGTNWGRILYADIRMTVLSDDGAKLLATADIRALNTTETSDLIKQYGTVFSRRVPILSRY